MGGGKVEVDSSDGMGAIAFCLEFKMITVTFPNSFPTQLLTPNSTLSPLERGINEIFTTTNQIENEFILSSFLR